MVSDMLVARSTFLVARRHVDLQRVQSSSLCRPV
jgi:hypothetical protein